MNFRNRNSKHENFRGQTHTQFEHPQTPRYKFSASSRDRQTHTFHTRVCLCKPHTSKSGFLLVHLRSCRYKERIRQSRVTHNGIGSVVLFGPRARSAPYRYALPALDSSQNEEPAHARNLPQVPSLQNIPIIAGYLFEIYPIVCFSCHLLLITGMFINNDSVVGVGISAF